MTTIYICEQLSGLAVTLGLIFWGGWYEQETD